MASDGPEAMKLTPRQMMYLAFTFAEIVFINSNYAIVAAFFQVHATTVLAFSRADAATVFAAFSFSNLVFSPVSGPLASRFGRRRVLIFGVAMVSLSTTAFGLVPDIVPGSRTVQMALFVATRLMQGSGAALATTCIFADLTDRFPSNQGKVIGRLINRSRHFY
jgi:MFS family permease